MSNTDRLLNYVNRLSDKQAGQVLSFLNIENSDGWITINSNNNTTTRYSIVTVWGEIQHHSSGCFTIGTGCLWFQDNYPFAELIRTWEYEGVKYSEARFNMNLLDQHMEAKRRDIVEQSRTQQILYDRIDRH